MMSCEKQTMFDLPKYADRFIDSENISHIAQDMISISALMSVTLYEISK